jgi:hypothetical protein
MPEDRATINARYRAAHPDRVARLGVGRRARGVAMVRAAKNVPCADCGQRFQPVCMDFDHREGEAKHPALRYAGGRVIRSMTSLACQSPRLFAIEAAKCDVVCANCHRLRTWRRRCGDHKLDETKP